MGLTEDRISSKLKRLDKEITERYQQLSPNPTKKMMNGFDGLDAKLHERLGVRPISSVEIDMAMIDYRKQFNLLCLMK